MTQQRRSRRPTTAPEPATPGGRIRTGASAAEALAAVTEAEPSLGEVRFDEWFETPVFESGSDERLEELATSRRGPMRLAASTFLRLNARADRMRHRDEPPAAETASEAASPGVRARVSAALDRWAEREAATQSRIERLLLPRRWQS